MGVLDGVETVGAIFWVNVGHPTVNNGDLLHSCAKVCE